MQPRPKRFGACMTPFHSPIEHPLLALGRDLELLTWLDELAFDEAWVGEHPQCWVGVHLRTRPIPR